MKRWTRTNKQELAQQIRECLAKNLRPGQIARAVGKTTQRVWQIRKLFNLYPERT